MRVDEIERLALGEHALPRDGAEIEQQRGEMHADLGYDIAGMADARP